MHLLLATALGGGLGALLVLLAAESETLPRPTVVAAFRLFSGPVNPAGLAFLFTGLAFGLFTRWGFARYVWVIFKWLGTVVLGASLVAGLGPAIATVAALADTWTGPEDLEAYRSASRAAFTWTLLLLVLTAALITVSVFKPGRARRPATRTFPPRRQLAGTALGIALAVMLVAQWLSLEYLRSIPVAAPPVTLVPPGRYQGSASVGGFDYGVELVARGGRLESLRVTRNRAGLYPGLGARVRQRIIDDQSVCVDHVTGASTTSRAIQAAAADALRKAVGEPAAVRDCDAP